MNPPVDDPAERRRVFFRRLALGALAVITTGIATYGALRVLLINRLNPLEWPVLPLFVILVFPIALSFWTAVFGFVVQLNGGDELALTKTRVTEGRVDLGAFRTAIVIPAYNEDALRLFAGLKATYESVEHTGQLRHFDFFLLSDTTDPDVWIREEMAFHDLRREANDPARLFYRNRRENIERKAGNIADFCATWGGQYRYMVVFDADSLMTGESLVNLVRLMEKHPNVGILQTPPVAVNRQSLFGRLLQFSTRVYGPMFITGLNFWQAGESNYWGHNAIIRVQPFAAHCRLPRLPGKEPLGGSILSHDFVEAALMRRAGWKVYLVSELGGSYEEIPANLIGHAARDRRWCQGNLQHARLLTMPGINWVNRLHLAMGVMSYAASPLWMLMLLFSTSDALRTTFAGHDYFRPDQSPFPVLEVSIADQAVLLLTSVLSMLLLPKLLSLAGWLAGPRGDCGGFGGPWKLTVSIVAETLFSVLVAPLLAMLHSRFVISTLLGRKVEWAPQDRGDVETPLRAAFRLHLGLTSLGVVWSLLLRRKDQALFWWLSPVLAGWVLSIPISAWTSKVNAGQWARAHGLFLTPEEVRPPPILRRFHQILETAVLRSWAAAGDGLHWVLSDPQVRDVHLALLPPGNAPDDPLARHRLQGLRLKLQSLGEHALLPKEKRELLCDADSIKMLGGNFSVGHEKTPHRVSPRN
jgi:membrane glycosyltransferase